MSQDMTALKTSQVLRDGICVIEVAGRLDSHTSPRAQSEFVDAVRRHQRVLLDCSHTTFMSSGGLRAIIISHREARQAGSKLAICIS